MCTSTFEFFAKQITKTPPFLQSPDHMSSQSLSCPDQPYTDCSFPRASCGVLCYKKSFYF